MEILQVPQRITWLPDFAFLSSLCRSTPTFPCWSESVTSASYLEPLSPCLLGQWHQGQRCPRGNPVFKFSGTTVVYTGCIHSSPGDWRRSPNQHIPSCWKGIRYSASWVLAESRSYLTSPLESGFTYSGCGRGHTMYWFLRQSIVASMKQNPMLSGALFHVRANRVSGKGQGTGSSWPCADSRAPAVSVFLSQLACWCSHLLI